MISDLAAHLARHTTATHRQVQDMIDRAKAAGANPEHVIHYHPADALIVLRLMSEAHAIESMLSRPSANPAGTPKPQAPVKARGRHGSRVQRSTRRRREWRRMCAKYGTITEPKEGQ